jgi:hypothetical protein
MARLARTYSDSTQTCPAVSADTSPGQTRTYAFRHVRLSGVRTASNTGDRGSKNFEDNPMNRDLSQRLAQMNDTPRCGAKTRAGPPCRCPAMENGKCRLHGGLSPGAPRGSANGRFRDGFWTHEAVEERRFIRLLLKGTLGGKS